MFKKIHYNDMEIKKVIEYIVYHHKDWDYILVPEEILKASSLFLNQLLSSDRNLNHFSPPQDDSSNFLIFLRLVLSIFFAIAKKLAFSHPWDMR